MEIVDGFEERDGANETVGLFVKVDCEESNFTPDGLLTAVFLGDEGNVGFAWDSSIDDGGTGDEGETFCLGL